MQMQKMQQQKKKPYSKAEVVKLWGSISTVYK